MEAYYVSIQFNIGETVNNSIPLYREYGPVTTEMVWSIIVNHIKNFTGYTANKTYISWIKIRENTVSKEKNDGFCVKMTHNVKIFTIGNKCFSITFDNISWYLDGIPDFQFGEDRLETYKKLGMPKDFLALVDKINDLANGKNKITDIPL